MLVHQPIIFELINKGKGSSTYSAFSTQWLAELLNKLMREYFSTELLQLIREKQRLKHRHFETSNKLINQAKKFSVAQHDKKRKKKSHSIHLVEFLLNINLIKLLGSTITLTGNQGHRETLSMLQASNQENTDQGKVCQTKSRVSYKK